MRVVHALKEASAIIKFTHQKYHHLTLSFDIIKIVHALKVISVITIKFTEQKYHQLTLTFNVLRKCYFIAI